ncbi:MAG: hypothetical protein CM15mP74_20500 [Halieaceae bacterium]|nr:MAG: hypothetical protein CM15mP74_20500 [Halieaceae bacterium]
MSVQHIPIFTYHSLNAPGNTYSSNDHVALECDLITLKALGYRVLPLPQLIDRFWRTGWIPIAMIPSARSPLMTVCSMTLLIFITRTRGC